MWAKNVYPEGHGPLPQQLIYTYRLRTKPKKILIAQQQRNDYNNRKVGINIIFDLPQEVQGGGWITKNSSLTLHLLS